MGNRHTGKRGPWIPALICFLLCAALCACALADSGIERDADGGTWDYDRGIYTDPSGKEFRINPDGAGDSAPSASSGQSSDGAMVIDTGEADPLAGIERNSDGSITVESGQGGVDIEIEPTRAPLTPEEWAELNAKSDLRNGAYTPTVYRDPATGTLTEVEVRYIGIGRSMIVLNGQNTLVNTVDLTWQTDAPEDKVLAVIDTPKNGYAWLRMKPSNKKTSAKLEQCRLDRVVRVISTGKNWTLVDYNGKRGYVQTSSLEFYANDHTDFLPGVLSVKGRTKGNDTANIRSRDSKHRILDEYPLGTPVTVFDIVDEWAEIDICGWHCVINSKFLTLEKETAAAD